MGQFNFECRHGEHHGDDEWEELMAFDASSAALQFAKKMDDNDSEMFVRPDQDEAVILVRKVGDTKHEAFSVGFDYRKSFYARRERVKETF